MKKCEKCIENEKELEKMDDLEEIEDFDEFDDVEECGGKCCCCKKKKLIRNIVIGAVAGALFIAGIIYLYQRYKRRKEYLAATGSRSVAGPVAKAAGAVALPLAIKDSVGAFENGKKKTQRLLEKKAKTGKGKKSKEAPAIPVRNYIPLNFENMQADAGAVFEKVSDIFVDERENGGLLRGADKVKQLAEKLPTDKIKGIAEKIPADKVRELAGKIRIEDAADMVKQARKKIGKRGYIDMDELFHYKKQ